MGWADTRKDFLCLHLTALGYFSTTRATAFVQLLALALTTIFREYFLHNTAPALMPIPHIIFCPHNSGIYIADSKGSFLKCIILSSSINRFTVSSQALSGPKWSTLGKFLSTHFGYLFWELFIQTLLGLDIIYGDLTS